MTKVFIVKQTEFCPERCPVVGFFRDGDRRHLLRDYSPDDLIVVMITKGSKDDVKNRGCFLGIASFYPEEVNGEDFIDKNDIRFKGYYNKKGEYKWPYAVKLKNAWKFSNPRIAEQMISEKTSIDANWRAARLSEKQARAMLKLFEGDAKEEILMDYKVNNVENLLAENVGNKKGARAKGRSYGPPPTSHSIRYKRNFKGPAYVYVSSFSDSDIWKIGWAKDVANRLKSLNEHVPHEFLEQNWKPYLNKKYDSGKIAYDAEQAMLDLMEAEEFSMWGERVQCSEEDIKKAWKKLKQMF